MTDDNGLLSADIGTPTTPDVADTGVSTDVADDATTEPVNAADEVVLDGELSDDLDKNNDEESNYDYIPDKFIDENGEPNLEALAESYKNLEKGIIEKNVPEEYNDESFGELNLSWGEGEAAESWKTKVIDVFKKNNMSQDDFDALMPLYSEALQSMAVMTGEPLDEEVEKEKLLQAYGSPESAQQAVSDVSAFAKTLHDDVFKHPIHKTAAGMALLHQLAKGRTGPSLVSTKQNSIDVVDLQAKAGKIINDPAYGKNTAAGRALEAQIDTITAQIARTRPDD